MVSSIRCSYPCNCCPTETRWSTRSHSITTRSTIWYSAGGGSRKVFKLKPRKPEDSIKPRTPKGTPPKSLKSECVFTQKHQVPSAVLITQHKNIYYLPK